MQTKLFQIGVLIIVFILGFVLGKMNVQTPADFVIDTAKNSYSEMTNSSSEVTGDSNAIQSASDTSTTNTSGGITDTQKKMIESFGLDSSSITITAQMVVCAETKLGKSRIEEFKNGATPSFKESATLAACYSQ